MKTKPIKARTMWQCKGGITIEPYLATRQEGKRAKRLFLLPATSEAYDQMVSQATFAAIARDSGDFIATQHRASQSAMWIRESNDSVARFAAVGIKRPTK